MVQLLSSYSSWLLSIQGIVWLWTNIGAVPTISATTSPIVSEIIENRELQLQSLKDSLARAQNRMKLQADNKRSDAQFAVGDKVLLKLQPYT